MNHVSCAVELEEINKFKLFCWQWRSAYWHEPIRSCFTLELGMTKYDDCFKWLAKGWPEKLKIVLKQIITSTPFIWGGGEVGNVDSNDKQCQTVCGCCVSNHCSFTFKFKICLCSLLFQRDMYCQSQVWLRGVLGKLPVFYEPWLSIQVHLFHFICLLFGNPWHH